MESVAVRGVRPRLRDGVIAALAGMVVFGLLHWALLAPVWAVFLEGIPVAIFAGLAFGWAHHELLRCGTPGVSGGQAALLGPATLAPALPAVLFGAAASAKPALGVIVVLAVLLPFGLTLGLGRFLLRRWRPALAAAAGALLPSAFIGGGVLDSAPASPISPQLACGLGGAFVLGGVYGLLESFAEVEAAKRAAVTPSGGAA